MNKEYITIGRGTSERPEFINGLTVQCKNCERWGKNGHCGAMWSEVFDGESWCNTVAPVQFFKPKVMK